jgi:hypothetical protein
MQSTTRWYLNEDGFAFATFQFSRSVALQTRLIIGWSGL